MKRVAMTVLGSIFLTLAPTYKAPAAQFSLTIPTGPINGIGDRVSGNVNLKKTQELAQQTQLIQTPNAAASTNSNIPPQPKGSFEVNASDENPVAQLKNNSGVSVLVTLTAHIKVQKKTAPWFYGTDPVAQAGLTGNPLDPNQQQMVNPNYKVGMLLGRLSTDPSNSFAVGYYSKVTIPAGATLTVFVNDAPGGYSNNSGTAVVQWSAQYLQ